ncbi:type IVB secretion system protein IcmH/DotU [Microbulbifer hydrolyticus]|uniref:DotU family type IV/VI secretion system protein n=1 Tax=Microbulbifer hydrolyticus TaxID=48074 RepID=A0A6P1T4N1_9GAMM|nr:type IVB secretion system protein IcmH/DotU [Microbulbifer hydrolyticus]MBB5211401.1 type VI secretion system protein ImpK [Microbulbifer hydrolyticus]QHQ37844.1 DotU family type IV/VI secretion system protein [Microbulbifer hydrolyticus]
MTNDAYTPPSADDRTVMVPTPGAAVAASQRPRAQNFSTGDGGPELQIRNSLNPLISAASKLLGAIIKLRTTMSHGNVPDLHKRLTREIQSFEREARQLSLSQDTVLTARYLLCSVVDEVVLTTPWGTASGWSQHSLLSLFHKETFGGEKCFQILQRTLETPGYHIELLELFYLCLSLGFQGKYRLVQRGYEQLEQIRENLYRTIESHRPPMDRDLSPRWQGCVERKTRLHQYVPLWVIASVVLGILMATFSGYRWWLYQSATPVANEIQALKIDSAGPNTKLR